MNLIYGPWLEVPAITAEGEKENEHTFGESFDDLFQ